jgi:Rieske Fe-S protein
MADTWPLDGIAPAPSRGAVLRFPGQARFHAVRYLAGLAAAIARHGGRVYSGAHVREVHDASGDAPCTVVTDRGITVRARDVIVATNTPFNDRVTMHTKQAPYRTYVVALAVERGRIPDALYWDTLEYYHYVRLLGDAAEAGADRDVLIVGGEDHKTGQEDDENAHFDALERWARANFPVGDVVARWSGQVMEPVDYLAYIGRNPGDRHVWIATGDSGNGITHGAIAGILLGALVRGDDHPWATLFDPSRITLKAAPTWIEENANVAAQYVDLVTPGEVSSVDEVPPGQGRILRDGLKKLAVYRDEGGAVTVRSAVCTHLGCIVDWNAAEKTWDCPCHGSRFSTQGEVLNGPASAPLGEAEPPGRER